MTKTREQRIAIILLHKMEQNEKDNYLREYCVNNTDFQVAREHQKELLKRKINQ